MTTVTTKKESNNEAAECCCMLTACCGGLGAIGATIAWFVIACIALSNVSNEDIKDQCPDSDIWPALLTWVVIVGLSLFGSKGGSNAAKDGDLCTAVSALFIVAAIYGSLNAWLGTELYASCVQEHLTDTSVYRMAFIWFVVVCAIVGIIVTAILVIVCIMCQAAAADAAENGRSSSAETVDRRSVAGRADDSREPSAFYNAGLENGEENV